MPVEPGQMLSHYRLVEKIGEGGMGVVWKAEDTKLHRMVALKSLPPSVAADAKRLERFKREATAIAALNHPNIVTVHSIEEAGGEHFLTMELVQGRMLSECIPADGLSLKRFFELAVPLAEAISAAHLQGITHRDLKPDNIMVGPDGRVKVLDFGLAKVSDKAPESSTGSAIPTRMNTEEGTVLGTAAYMAPEQAEGKPADARSDIFSLGIVLYEMATGGRPFKGDTGASIISSILRDTPPDITDLNKRLPRHLGRIIRRCLAKEPMRRYQVALEVRNELEELKREIDTGVTAPAGATGASAAGGRRRSPALFAVLVFATVAVVAIAASLWLRGDRSAPRVEDAPLRGTFAQVTDEAGREEYPSLSPDAKLIAYASPRSGNWDIYVQRVGGSKPISLTAGIAADDTQPAFSPDGESIAFRSERDGGGIFVMGATGESIRRLTTEGCNPSWSPDGKEIAYTTECFDSPLARASTSSLWIAPVAGGEPRRVYAGDAIQARFSPNGQRLAFWGVREGSGERDIWTIDVNGGEPILVTEQGPVDWNPAWSPDGRYLYYSSDRDGNMNLWRIPIDQTTGEPRGRPQPVTTGVGAWSQHASLSSDGRHIAYTSRLSSENPQKVAFDPATGEVTGDPQWISRGSVSLNNCTPSADEQRIVCQMVGKQEDIVILRADGSERRQLTDDPYRDRGPRWVPGSDEIVFYSDRSGSYEIWAINEDGSGLRQVTDTPGASTIWPVLSPDGKRLLYQNLRRNEARITDFTPASGRSQADRARHDSPQPDQARPDHARPDHARPDHAQPDRSQPDSPQPNRPQPETIVTGNTDRWLGPRTWSPDGRLLSGLIIDPNGRMTGVGTLDLTTGRFVELAARGGTPAWVDDSRHLVYAEGSTIRLMDATTGESHPILSVAPDSVENYSLQISKDGRTIYFTRDATASDIWLLTLE